jgi:D-beta-D-heptose 7-phosphate kinase/D-beta-D-heptose 1-phosphate adenosyltransferase
MSRIIRDREDLRDFCQHERQRGLSIVFTNGVFDLFHVGHLDSLRRAKAEGDLLVVGVNSDESVKRLKGEGRPVLPLDQRLRILSAIEYVNVVTPFDEDTPAALIEAVAPDVLVKGGHYTVEQIVGHQFVLERGGRVLSMPLIEGRSTTDIIGVIKERFLQKA